MSNIKPKHLIPIYGIIKLYDVDTSTNVNENLIMLIYHLFVFLSIIAIIVLFILI